MCIVKDEKDIAVIGFHVTLLLQFLVPQIEHPLGGSSKKGSHVYFMLVVAMVLLL